MSQGFPNQGIATQGGVGVLGGSTGGGGGGSPGGSDTQVQFNDSGSFGGSSKLVFVKATGALTLTGTFLATNISGSTSGANTGDQTITLTGDVTGTGTGSFAATIANSAVTLAKQANMATASVVYRKTAGSGAPEVNTLATLKTDLGLTGTNSGDQTITLTGGVTGTGTGSFVATVVTNANLTGDVTSVGNAATLAAGSASVLNSGTLLAARMPALTGDVTTSAGAVATTIAAGVVTLAKQANLAQDQFIGRVTASTGVPETATITAAARTVLDDTTVGAMLTTLGGQPLDADLTTIAGLTATTDNFLQSKSSAWASRTVAQVAADLQGDGSLTGGVGFRLIPQNSQSAAYTTVLADSGKHLYHPGADTTARNWTIDSNANVAYPIGTTLTFVNDTSAGIITIKITSDTLVLAGAGTTGDRTLAANGIATAVKMTSTRWMINGTGLT